MDVTVIPVTTFEQNCTLLRCPATGRGALVDPGGDVDRLRAAVAGAGVELEKILVTHGHFDHVGAVARLSRDFGIPVEGPQRDDLFLLQALPEWCRQFGFPPAESFVPDRWLEQGDAVRVGDQLLTVHHCPGHTPGHVVFSHPVDRFALVGDVIFRGSIGRTDFPRGDHATLLHSIRSRVWTLGDDVLLYPGHGPTTTVGEERAHNPFLQGSYG